MRSSWALALAAMTSPIRLHRISSSSTTACREHEDRNQKSRITNDSGRLRWKITNRKEVNQMRKTYEAPEVALIGQADEVVMGSGIAGDDIPNQTAPDFEFEHDSL